MTIPKRITAASLMLPLFAWLFACSPALATPTPVEPTTTAASSLSPATERAPAPDETGHTPSAIPESLPADGDITSSATRQQTPTQGSPPPLATHRTTGIHLSLQLCKETQHFVVYCTDADTAVAPIIASHLESEHARITAHLHQELVAKTIVEIYPNLQSFHAAVNRSNAPDWFVGKAESGSMQLVTPLNPGPNHNFESILSTAVHEFTHLVVDAISDGDIPVWLDEGIAAYESGQRQPQIVAAQIEAGLPGISELYFGSGANVYAFSYTIVEFIVRVLGYEQLVALVVEAGDFQAVFDMSEAEFEQQWQAFVIAEYSQFREN